MNEYDYQLLDEVRAGRMTRRDLIRRGTVMGISVSSLGALLSACAPDEAGPSKSTPENGSAVPTRGGIIKQATTQTDAIVEPVTTNSAIGIKSILPAAEYLCLANEDYSLRTALAESWTPVDAKTWDFTLRRGVKFHSGALMTADDVIASFDRLADPETKSAAFTVFSGILAPGNIEKIGDHEVRFHLERPFVDFPYLTCQFNYNALILPRNYEMNSFTDGGVGTGPFILTKYVPNERVVFSANPDYWDPEKPYLDGWEVRLYEEATPINLALQSGEIDVYDGMPHAGSEGVQADSNVEVVEQPSSGYYSVHMRVDQEPFSDVRVRQAIALCLNREEIVQGIYKGRADIGNDHGFAPIFPPSPDSQEVAQRKQDYNQAKQLLADAGVAGGIEVQLVTHQFTDVVTYVTLIKEMCRAIGIDVDVNVMQTPAYYGSGDNQPWLQVPFGATKWEPRGTASQLIRQAYTCDGAWNSAHWCNQSFDQELAAFDGELDEQRRHEHAISAATIQRDETPAILAFFDTTLVARRANVHNYATPAASHGDVWLGEAQ